MKILHLSMLYPPHILGGAEKSVALLAEAQTALGHKVAASCISPSGEPPAQRNGVTVFRMPHETSFWPEEWPKHPLLKRGLRKFMQQFNTRLEQHFLDVAEEFDPDIVHTHSLVDVTPLVWRAAKRRNKPIVHTLRDFDLLCGHASLFRKGATCDKLHIQCQIMTFRKKLLHNHVDGVVGVGAEILQRHLDYGYFSHVPRHLRRVIWNPAVVDGAATDYKRPGREGQPFTFGYLGRINIEKGVGTLIQAAARITPGDWRVVIAGRPNDTLKPFTEMAKGLPIEFPGFMDARTFFEKIDVLVAPSIWPEPLPRTILEAFSVGVPAIGARSGGIPDLIGPDNKDWLYPPGDDAALACVMADVLERGREGLPGKSSFAGILEETTPAVVGQRYIDFYHGVGVNG